MDQPLRRSVRFDVRHPEDWVAWALRGGLLLAAVASWAVPGWDVFLRVSQSGLAIVGLALALGVAAVPAHRPRLMRLVEASVAFVFLLNWIGHALDLYGGTAWFDAALHALGGLLAGLSGYWVARATDLFWLRGEMAPFRAFWVALSAALVVGALFEVVEFTSDALLGTQTQNTPHESPHVDTMTDVMAEAGTGLAVSLGVAWWTRRRLRRRRPEQENAAGDRRHTTKL